MHNVSELHKLPRHLLLVCLDAAHLCQAFYHESDGGVPSQSTIYHVLAVCLGAACPLLLLGWFRRCVLLC